jgi:hypothetical protein
MNKALRSILSVSVALALVGCGSAPYRAAQAVSGPANNPDRVLDMFRTPDNSSDVILFCRNGDYYVYMNGYKEGNISQFPHDERCK